MNHASAPIHHNEVPTLPPATLEENPSLLEELLTASPSYQAPAPIAGMLVGLCVDAKHPTLHGRYQIEFRDASGVEQRRWLPSLYGITVRVQDRVLLQQPANWPEAIIMGVVDGFALRPEAERLPAAALTLQRDEAVRIAAADGQPLVEIFQNATGPVVRLLKEDVQLDLPGKLKISAQAIELKAKLGGVLVEATDDVVVRGENVKLN